MHNIRTKIFYSKCQNTFACLCSYGTVHYERIKENLVKSSMMSNVPWAIPIHTK